MSDYILEISCKQKKQRVRLKQKGQVYTTINEFVIGSRKTHGINSNKVFGQGNKSDCVLTFDMWCTNYKAQHMFRHNNRDLSLYIVYSYHYITLASYNVKEASYWFYI